MKNFNPKVSIVISVYNGSNYLKQAIDSALAQTYKNIEIIIVNDGSNDNNATEKIAKSYGDKIRYFKKENGGVATALNLGIKKMKGEYFSWLSHDDMYYPEKIEKQIRFLDDSDKKDVVLYSNYSLLERKMITPVYHNHEMLVRKKKYSLLKGCVNGITVLVPKRIIDDIGYFNKNLRCTQDYDYWQRMQGKYEFVHMKEVLSITRLHGNQDSVISPSAKTEGDTLWINMVNKLSDKEKKQYEGTTYNFYYEMVKFLGSTPYSGAKEYCQERQEKLEEKYAKEGLKYKVSVVVPFFNRPKETINSIKSVLAQTYKNIEIVLVNDASTDDISEVIKFVSDYGFVKLINMDKNAGPATARNIGIRAATGDYIAFLDSDDEFLKDKLHNQLAAMQKHNLDVSYTSYIKRRDGVSDVVVDGHGMTGLVVPGIISSCPIATPTVIVRRSILIDNNILFNEKIRISEDTCFWLELAKNHEILCIEDPLTVVNVSDISHAYDGEKNIIGIENILTYLFNDDYYSKFYYELSLLCNDFYRINQGIEKKKENELHVDGCHVGPGTIYKIKYRVRDTLPYRAAKKMYNEGAKSVIYASINKIKRRK